MPLASILALASAAFCAVLGVAVLTKKPRSAIHWCFVGGMSALAAEAAFVALIRETSAPGKIIFWNRMTVAALGLLPASWLFFSLLFARAGDPGQWRKTGNILGSTAALSLIGAAFFWDQLVVGPPQIGPTGDVYVGLATAGKILHVLFVIMAVGILMNLERTFRASVGTIRWRIKFMLLGLGVLFVVRIYTSSQALLFSAVKLSLLQVNTYALAVACLLIARSFVRDRPRRRGVSRIYRTQNAQ